MRILFLGINYWPEQTGIGVFNTWRCEYLARCGHSVTMCTAFPYYPEWNVPRERQGRLIQVEERNGVTIRRSAIYVPKELTTFKRLVHEASFTVGCAIRAASGRKPDVIVAVSTPLGTGLAARMLGGLWRIPFVFHVEDLQPDAAVDLGMLRKGSLTKGLYALERMVYRRAALISAITPNIAARIVAKGIPPQKVTVFGHGVDEALFRVPVMGGGARFRSASGLNRRFLVAHAGNMGVKQGLDVVLDAAAKAREIADLLFLLVGDGAARAALEKKARALQLTNVLFMPLQPREVYLDMLAASDVSLITQQRVVSDIVFPSKTETLLAAGRAVIGSVNSGSEVARVLREAQAEVVEPEDPDALLDAILRLRADPEQRRAMGEAGRNYARSRWAGTAMLAHMERCLIDVATGERPGVARLRELHNEDTHKQPIQAEGR